MVLVVHFPVTGLTCSLTCSLTPWSVDWHYTCTCTSSESVQFFFQQDDRLCANPDKWFPKINVSSFSCYLCRRNAKNVSVAAFTRVLSHFRLFLLRNTCKFSCGWHFPTWGLARLELRSKALVQRYKFHFKATTCSSPLYNLWQR